MPWLRILASTSAEYNAGLLLNMLRGKLVGHVF
jgi:hypothetical protein